MRYGACGMVSLSPPLRSEADVRLGVREGGSEMQGAWADDVDDPFLPIPLLVFAVQTAVTTLTCIAEALSWDHLDASGKASLVAGLYSPYLAVAVFMTVDMVRRLSARMERAVVLEGKATEKDRKGEGMGLLKSGKGE